MTRIGFGKNGAHGRRTGKGAGLAAGTLALVALGGCAIPPPQGPSFTALPGKGQTYQRFTQEDAYCRQNAFASIGGESASQAAVNSGVASAALGTAVGAVAGTVLGAAVGAPGAGAAIGAGSGLAFGAASGAGAADYSAAAQQHRYDATYAQCMVAYHNLVPLPPAYGPPGPYPGYAAVVAPYPPVVPYAPVGVGVGVGVGVP